MSLRQQLNEFENFICNEFGRFGHWMRNLEQKILNETNKHTLRMDDLQSQIRNLESRIINLKQEVCGLKTGHQFEFRGDCGPIFTFVCKLCKQLELKCESELTHAERKAMQSLGILNESAKCSNK